MRWTIEYSRDADRFIQAEGIQGEVRKQIEGFLKKLRIIFSIDNAGRSIYVERVDFRGDVYKC